MNDYLILTIGVLCAGIGGELFVRGAIGLAHWARVAPGIIAATVAAFATSSPELSVSVSAALAGKPQIALGDALGSNIVNVAVILGLALVISGIQCPRDSVKRDFPVALLIPIFTGVLFLDGELSRIDGVLMFGLFLAWLISAIIEARKQRSEALAELAAQSHAKTGLAFVIGLALLIVAGNLVVTGAKGIALSLGIDAFVIGATIVAIGTSVPELATTVVAKLRGRDEIGLGIILGSNIFNGVFIIAIAAMINPITAAWREVAITLLFGIMALVFTYPSRSGFIERRRGVLLVFLYAAYIASIWQVA